jgi:YfiH family protein
LPILRAPRRIIQFPLIAKISVEMSFELGSDGVLRWRPWLGIPWLVHGFSTRAAGDFSSLDREQLDWGGGKIPLAMLRQVHSDCLHVIRGSCENSRPSALPEGDALLSSEAGVLLGIRTADCLPLLLVDSRSKVVAAVHAGWRGSAKRIGAKTVEKLRNQFGTRPEDIEVLIGPGIGPCCYEVGGEVAAEFDGAVSRRGRRVYLDIEAVNKTQLREAGVPEAQIHTAGMCTGCLTEEFYSYRREGARAGRMLAVVGICGE